MQAWCSGRRLTERNLPANIQTDTLVRGVYCLDYAPGDLDAPGVVLLSYTWEDDSTTQMALGEQAHARQAPGGGCGADQSDFARHVVPIDSDYSAYTQIIDWQLEPHYYGVFKLNFPGNDQLSRKLFYQYLTLQDAAADPFVYLAGDSQSFTGGWFEGAIQSNTSSAARRNNCWDLFESNCKLTRNRLDIGINDSIED